MPKFRPQTSRSSDAPQQQLSSVNLKVEPALLLVHKRGATSLLCCVLQHSGAVVNQLIVPPTNLPEPTTNATQRTARRNGQSVLVTSIRQSVRSAQLTSSAEAVAFWRTHDQNTYLIAKRSVGTASVRKTARRAGLPQVDMQAVFDRYKVQRQRHDNNLDVALRRVESKLRRKNGGK